MGEGLQFISLCLNKLKGKCRAVTGHGVARVGSVTQLKTLKCLYESNLAVWGLAFPCLAVGLDKHKWTYRKHGYSCFNRYF